MTTHSNKIDAKLLMDYVRGNLNQIEREAVELWYEESTDNAALLQQLYDTYTLNRSLDAFSADENKAYNRFKYKLKQKETKQKKLDRRRLKRFIGRVAVAAVFTLAVVFSSIWSVQYISKLERQIVVSTNVGERVQVKLPDGTKVWLNACSEIKYGPSLLSSERRVEMIGEVYFEVAKDPNAPFVVDCNSMEVKVLGTKFNVRSNIDEDVITTTLLEGSVKVNSALFKNKDGVKMKPNQQLRFNKKTGLAELSLIDEAINSKSWVDGKFSFTRTSFDEIAQSLERHYNIHIVFKDDIIRQKKFTCGFDSSDNIYRILSILELTGKFDYKIYGRQVEISSRQSSTMP